MAQNLVPTTATRHLVDAMVNQTVAKGSGYDAANQHLPDVDPQQIAALVGMLLNLATRSQRPEPGRVPTVYSEAERRAGHSRYRQGLRDPITVAQAREYQRLRARIYRSVKGRGRAA